MIWMYFLNACACAGGAVLLILLLLGIVKAIEIWNTWDDQGV